MMLQNLALHLVHASPAAPALLAAPAVPTVPTSLAGMAAPAASQLHFECLPAVDAAFLFVISANVLFLDFSVQKLHSLQFPRRNYVETVL